MNNNINNNENENSENSENNENKKTEATEAAEATKATENGEKKMAETEKKSAFPILSVGIIWLLCIIVFKFRINATSIFLTTVLSLAAYYIMNKIFPPKKIEIIMEKTPPKPQEKEKEKEKKAPSPALSPEEREFKDLNERIGLYFIELKLLSDSIGDAFISSELHEIENLLKKIQVQLNEDTQKSKSNKAEQLSQFFDYYMPTTIKILNSYRRIEKQNLTGENATETKKRVEESLPFIKKAFEKELDNIFSDEMLDITTDIDVLESMLSKDGLMEKNSIYGMKDVKNDAKDEFLN